MNFSLSVREAYDNWMTNKEVIMFGEHELVFELIDEFDESFLYKAQEELRETPENIAKGYKELRELITMKMPDVVMTEDNDIYQMFLRPCKWYAESAFSLINRLSQYRKTYSHIFTDLVPSKQKIGLCSNLLYPLPIRCNDGSRIVIIEGGKAWKPKEHPLDDCWKGMLFLLLSAMMEPKTQISGARVILDVEGLSLSQITYLTPSFAKMVLDFLNKCVPLRLKSIHIVNQSFIFNVAYAIFKPFIGEKLRKRIHFHGTNWQTLMNIIDKKALLKKHGGEIDMPVEDFGVKLWHSFLAFDSLFEVFEDHLFKSNFIK